MCVCVFMTRQRALVNKTLKLSLWNSIYFSLQIIWYVWGFYSSFYLRLSFLWHSESFEIIVTVLYLLFWNDDHHENNRSIVKRSFGPFQKNYHDLYLYAKCSLVHSFSLLSFKNFHLFNYSSSSSSHTHTHFKTDYMISYLYYTYLYRAFGSFFSIVVVVVIVEMKDPWNVNDTNCQ